MNAPASPADHGPGVERLEPLLAYLGSSGYQFVAVTPATHERVIARQTEARDLRGIFGWNLPFEPSLLPADMFALLRECGALDRVDGLYRSKLRAASLGDRLLLHSGFPTDGADAVFFGPDTYRFAAFIRRESPQLGPVNRLVDLGAGSGAGGLVAAAQFSKARVTLVDVNPAALAFAAVNARHAGIAVELVEGSGLDVVEGPIDLVIANPPYMMDEGERAYRDGGGLLGAGLSLEWALSAGRRLESGGHMLLYTGVAIVSGVDRLRQALERELPALGCTLRYGELDPDVFGEELETPAYREVERIAAIGAVIGKM
jgi:hypothetical protein